MVRSKHRLWLCGGLLILTVAFIWGNSALPSPVSSSMSRWVFALLRGAGEGEYLPAYMGEGYLRKLAHFAEFTWLALLLSWMIRMLRTSRWQWYVLPLMAGTAVACVDETIQGLTPGRSPALADVGIDISGVVLGILLVSAFTLWNKQKRRKDL